MTGPSRPTQSELRRAETVAYGAKPKLQITGFKKMRRNMLRGFVSVQFVSGVRLLDCPVHFHPQGRAWVALPGKPLVDDQGRHKRDANGKPAHVPTAEWRDRATSDQFSELVIGLLVEKYPDALGGAAS